MTLDERIISKSVKSNINDCIIWKGFCVKNNTRNTVGIPYIWDNNVKPRVMINVPRHILERKLGRKLKPIYQANHTCDNINGACINENHIYEGTQYNNVRDMFNRNRAVVIYGERHKDAKLSNDNLELIRLLLLEGFLQKDIAKIFSVSDSHISNIKCGRTRI